MKKFFFHISLIVLILIVLAIALDFIYNSIYSHSSFRNKIQFAKNTQKKDFDLIILGSSRANNHFDTSIFEKKGIKTFNFGMDGSTLLESLITLDILLHNQNKIKNIIVEADLNLSLSDGNIGSQMPLLSYLNESYIFEYLKNQPDYYQYKLIPFYRYSKNETKLGIRELFMTLNGKISNCFLNNGFKPLYENGNNLKYDLSIRKLERNKSYEKIKLLCKQNKINLFVVTTPMCENTKGMEYFEKVRKIYPEIYNFENVVKEDKYFSSCGHMNNEGAKKYTIFVYEYFKTNFAK